MKTLPTRWQRGGRALLTGLEMVAGVALFGLMLLTTVDVAGRFFFNSPILGAVELTQLLLATVVFLALPTVCWREDHVSVDLLDAVFPARWIWLRQLAVNLIVTTALSVMARRVWLIAERSLDWGDVTEFLRIPVGYLYYLMALMLAASALLTLVRALRYLLEGLGIVEQGGVVSQGGES